VHAGEVLDDLRDNGRVAVGVQRADSIAPCNSRATTRPSRRAGPTTPALAERYVAGFVEEIGRLGFNARLAHTILSRDDAPSSRALHDRRGVSSRRPGRLPAARSRAAS
jgi:hypothetical protein